MCSNKSNVEETRKDREAVDYFSFPEVVHMHLRGIMIVPTPCDTFSGIKRRAHRDLHKCDFCIYGPRPPLSR